MNWQGARGGGEKEGLARLRRGLFVVKGHSFRGVAIFLLITFEGERLLGSRRRGFAAAGPNNAVARWKATWHQPCAGPSCAEIRKVVLGAGSLRRPAEAGLASGELRARAALRGPEGKGRREKGKRGSRGDGDGSWLWAGVRGQRAVQRYCVKWKSGKVVFLDGRYERGYSEVEDVTNREYRCQTKPCGYCG